MQSPTIPVLRRGEACVECRRRKLRCDGAKPNCTICLKADRKCRYEKILARPVYLVLQERLAALERRYQRLTSASPRTAILRTTMPTIQIDTPTPVQDMTGQWWEPEDLSPAIRDYLVNIFMLHRPSIHFCFHEPTFRARLASPDEAERPHRALLESIYLFACYFSSRFPDNQSLVHHEEHFLRRARQALMESLSYSDRLMDFLRGSVLLTQYLYMRGRFLEGYHVHCGAARFALSCGLHRLTSFIFNSPVYTNSNPSNIVLLQPPANGIELGERISTFWMIYMCDKLSSVVAGFVCALPSESDAVDSVETVFPRMMDEYELGTVSDVGSVNLLSLFDHLSPTATPQRDSCWTVIIKGFAILERAIKLSATYRARPTSNSAVALRRLELAANRFMSTLRPVAYFISEDVSTENMNSEDMAIFMAHNTVLGALMEIHQTLVDVDEKAYEARLSCAKSMAELTIGVKEGGLVYGCLIGVGFCWCLAAQVLIQHIESNVDKELFVENYEAQLAKIVSALEKLSLTFPMLVHQFKQVQEALGRIGGLSGTGVFPETNSESE